MMSLGEIVATSRKWAEDAAKEKRTPFVYFDEKEVVPPWPFPVLGTYIPEGWHHVEDLLCDSSGFGRSGELALTPQELQQKILEYLQKPEEYGYGIREKGPFQIVVGVYYYIKSKKASQRKARRKTDARRAKKAG